jgi:hypothetical protein
MIDLSSALLQNNFNAWLLMPTAILLGILHGLEPGHSKTMMAAFIVAVRGTVSQAVLLGLSATLSHTAIVWLIALTGLYFGERWNLADNEAYFQIASAILMAAIAIWMLLRTWRYSRAHNHHDHTHDHSHHHHPQHQDAHERAHADDIKKRFHDRNVTTGQIILFGLTGGLIPCPAAITVLLICLQLKNITLGATLVLCFSIGLALTMVTAGTMAALSLKHLSKRWTGFGTLAQRAPYVSAVLILAVSVYLLYSGVVGLM